MDLIATAIAAALANLSKDAIISAPVEYQGKLILFGIKCT